MRLHIQTTRWPIASLHTEMHQGSHSVFVWSMSGCTPQRRGRHAHILLGPGVRPGAHQHPLTLTEHDPDGLHLDPTSIHEQTRPIFIGYDRGIYRGPHLNLS